MNCSLPSPGLRASAFVWIPSLIGSFGSDTRRILTFQIVKLGALAITPVFLLKAIFFLVLLALVSTLR